jgi:hypothetical protein
MIETRCACGRALVLRDELAGRRIRCPECGGTLEAPRVVEMADVSEEGIRSAESGPPPLPARSDEDLADRAVVEIRPGPPPLTGALRPAREHSDPEEPPPVPRRFGRPKRKRRKKQSLYNEFYGDESGREYANDWLGIAGGGLTTILGALFLFLMGIALLAVGVVWIGGIIMLLTLVFGAAASAMNGSKDE